jgi:phosphotransacetylase
MTLQKLQMFHPKYILPCILLYKTNHCTLSTLHSRMKHTNVLQNLFYPYIKLYTSKRKIIFSFKATKTQLRKGKKLISYFMLKMDEADIFMMCFG